MKVIFTLILFFVLVYPVVAETPGDAIREIIDSIRTSQSELPLLKRVDWEQAFSSRESFSGWKNYNSAQSMREFYFNRMQPGSLSDAAERSRLSQGKPSSREDDKLALNLASEKASKAMRELLKKIKYSIGSVSVNGSRAKVNVIYDWGRAVEKEIELIQTENSWHVTNPEIALFLGLDKIEEMRQIANK